MSGSSAPRSWPRAGESIQGGSSALFSLLIILPSVFLLCSPLPFFPWVLLAGGGDASCGLCCRSCPRCSRFAPGPRPLPAAGEGPRRADLASRSGGAAWALLVAALLSAWEQRDQAGRALRLLPLLAAAVCHGLFVHLEERRAIGRGRRGAARAGMAPGAPAPCLRDPGGPSRASLGPVEKKKKKHKKTHQFSLFKGKKAQKRRAVCTERLMALPCSKPSPWHAAGIRAACGTAPRLSGGSCPSGVRGSPLGKLPVGPVGAGDESGRRAAAGRFPHAGAWEVSARGKCPARSRSLAGLRARAEPAAASLRLPWC